MLQCTQHTGPENSIGAVIRQLRSELSGQVRLIAVSKQVALAPMRLAYEAGVRDFGESRVQELQEKKKPSRT
jgi:uncharacterized pyridoxal phosphate-containing UPF0001 family protein